MALTNTQERVRADMDRLPDGAKVKLARFFHERREELSPPEVLDDIEEAIADLEGRDEHPGQAELLPR
ncbi:MAG: hypothetical protein ACREF4_07575 [Gammaproteobacteria bacterium]